MERALRIVQESVPDIGADLALQIFPVPSLQAALGTLSPRPDYSPAWVQVHQSPELLAFCYGSLVGIGDSARRIADEFRTGGAEAVHHLDGSFAGLLVDQLQRRVFITTDLIGMRAPRCVVGDSTLAVASHDLIHIAAGEVACEFDLASVATLIACDWSMGGHPLVKGITRQAPWQIRAWSLRSTGVTSVGPIDSNNRIDPGDQKAIARQLDRVLDEMLLATRGFVAENPRVRASLTAGLDSRGVLSLLVAAAPRELVLNTSGGDRALDVRVARRLARLVGAQHQCALPSKPTIATFEAHNRLRCFSLDGMGDARRAMTPLPRWTAERPVQAGGEGGEILRGFFYQYFGIGAAVPNDIEQLARTLLKWRFRRVHTLRFEQRVADSIEQRLRDALAALEPLGQGGYDTLDLLYLYERYGQWGAAGERSTWRRRWTPYESKAALFSAFHLPQPIGTRAVLAPLAVRRFLPARAFWVPVNGSSSLALEGPGRLRSVLRQALHLQGKLQSEFERKLNPKPVTSGDVRAHWIVNDYARSLFTETGSFALALFGNERLLALLREQQARRKHSASLAYLLSAEEFRRLALATAERALHQ